MAAHLREYAWMGIPRTRSHSFSQWAICPALDALGAPRLDRVSSLLELAVELTFLNRAMASTADFGEVGLPDCSDLCPALPLPAYVKLDRAAADQVGRVRHRNHHAARCSCCIAFALLFDACPAWSHQISLCVHQRRSLSPRALPLPAHHWDRGVAVSLVGHRYPDQSLVGLRHADDLTGPGLLWPRDRSPVACPAGYSAGIAVSSGHRCFDPRHCGSLPALTTAHPE